MYGVETAAFCESRRLPESGIQAWIIWEVSKKMLSPTTHCQTYTVNVAFPSLFNSRSHFKIDYLSPEKLCVNILRFGFQLQTYAGMIDLQHMSQISPRSLENVRCNTLSPLQKWNLDLYVLKLVENCGSRNNILEI